MASWDNTGARRRPEATRQSPYLVEALFLLVILATAVAVFMSLFSSAVRQGNESVRLDEANRLACNAAERFSADPSGMPELFEEDGYQVLCDVQAEKTPAGTLWHANIMVFDAGADARSGADAPIFSVVTSRYESEVG